MSLFSSLAVDVCLHRQRGHILHTRTSLHIRKASCEQALKVSMLAVTLKHNSSGNVFVLPILNENKYILTDFHRGLEDAV